MLRKYRIWIILIVVAALAGGGYYVYAGPNQPAEESETEEVRTTIVRQGDLVLYATGTGSAVAATEVDLSFGMSGEIAEIHVQVGDVVSAGDMLASLEEGDSLESLQVSVTSAELSLLRAQQDLEELYESVPMEAALAQKALAEAIDAMQDAEYYWQVQQQGYRASSETILAAEAALVLAESEVEKAQARYNEVEGKSDDDPAKALALSNLVAAKTKRDSTLRELNWFTGSPTDTDQALLDADVAIAQANLEAAQREWEVLMNGADPIEVAVAEAEVANAEAQLARAQADLEEAIANQDEIELIAPMDGTVMAVNARVGENAQGTIVTLADLSQTYLEIFLDETDLGNVQVGFEVEVIFDALPDDTFSGTIVRVDPSLYTSQNVSAIKALVQLDDPALSQVDTLPVGLSAAVDVIGGRAENALLVPIEALRELSPGEYAVFVMEDGEPKLRFVEVGLMDFTYAEVISGVEAGEVITTGIVETG